MSYRELAPPPIVRCVWVRWRDDRDAIVLPEGCVDVIVWDGEMRALAGATPAKLRAT